MPIPTTHATPKLLPPPGQSIHTLSIDVPGEVKKSTTSSGPPAPLLFHDAVVVRTVVFNVEQKCDPALEIDADDAISWHWVIYDKNEEGHDVPAASIRLIPAQAHASADDLKAVDGPKYEESKLWDHKEPYVMLGRLATVKTFRGTGYGKMLVQAALEYAGMHGGDMVHDKELGEWKGLVMLHGQRWLEGWYKSLGFATDEGMGIWLEEGIEHVGMWRRLEIGNQ